MFTRARTNIADFYERVASVTPGQTRAEELPVILGSPPNNIIPLGQGKSLFIYAFGDSKTGGLNLIIFNIQKTNVGIDSAIFTIVQGVVEEVNVSTNSENLDFDIWPFGG